MNKYIHDVSTENTTSHMSLGDLIPMASMSVESNTTCDEEPPENRRKTIGPRKGSIRANRTQRQTDHRQLLCDYFQLINLGNVYNKTIKRSNLFSYEKSFLE